jgi:hypothetical protein
MDCTISCIYVQCNTIKGSIAQMVGCHVEVQPRVPKHLQNSNQEEKAELLHRPRQRHKRGEETVVTTISGESSGQERSPRTDDCNRLWKNLMRYQDQTDDLSGQ